MSADRYFAREFRMFCDEYTSVTGLDSEMIYTINFHEDPGPVSLTVSQLRAAADRIEALEAETAHLQAKNAMQLAELIRLVNEDEANSDEIIRLDDENRELREFIGEPVTLADLKASIEAHRAAGSSTPLEPGQEPNA